MSGNCRGSALLETTASLFVVIPLVTGLFAICYLFFLSLWIDFHGYEAMICAAEYGRDVGQCNQQYQARVRQLMPRGVEHHGYVFRAGSHIGFRSFVRARLRWNVFGRNHYQILNRDQNLWLP